MVVLWSFKMRQAVPLPLGESRQSRKVQLVYNTRDIEQRAAIVGARRCHPVACGEGTYITMYRSAIRFIVHAGRDWV